MNFTSESIPLYQNEKSTSMHASSTSSFCDFLLPICVAVVVIEVFYTDKNQTIDWHLFLGIIALSIILFSRYKLLFVRYDLIISTLMLIYLCILLPGDVFVATHPIVFARV